MPANPQTLQQGSMGNTCARACLRTTMPEIILLVVHHPQHVCVCVWVGRGATLSPWGSHHVDQAPYTSRPDSVEHRGIHLSPTLTPLGFTSTPLSIIQRQSNYCLESEPSISSVMRGSWAENDETGIVTLLIITQHSVITSTLLCRGISERDMERERKRRRRRRDWV